MNDLPARDDVWDWMKERNQWRLWSRDSNPAKKPLDANGTGKGWNDPGCWLSFDEAYELAQTDSRFDGIGFVVSKADPYWGIDVDGGLREPNAEKPKEWVPSLEPLANQVAMQFSTSGTGFHAFGVGAVPEWWSDSDFDDRDHEGVEAYEEKFFIVTGRELSVSAGQPGEVSPSEFLYEAYKAINGEYPREETDTSSGRGGDSEWTKEQIASALDAISSDCGYAKWRNIGFAVYDWDDGSTGKALFESWSRGAGWDSDSQRHIDNIWSNASEGSENDNSTITVGTLIHHAMNEGWSPSGGSSSTTSSNDKATSDDANAATDGGATTDSSAPTPATKWPLEPATVAREASLGEDGSISDLSDREKAAIVWKILRRTNEEHVCVRRDTDAIWAYDEGVWTREGERTLRHAARQALGAPNYGANVLSELKAQARSDVGAEVSPDRFGVEPGTLAVGNGLLDLEKAATGEGEAIRPLKPTDYALTQLPVDYDPGADAPEWREFVAEVVENDRVKAVQEYVGYCLHVGAMPIHRALMLVGTGANGKSVFLSTVRAMLGAEPPHDNTTSTELQTLANERDAVASFYGSLANIDDDLSARKLGNGIGMFKKLTGDNQVEGRHLYEERFKFDATGKHLYAANEVPDVSEDVDDDDDAFWRRWLIVEFPNYYPPDQRDPTLTDKFTEADTLAGVLNWAIEGWHRLMENGRFSNEETDSFAKQERWRKWGDSLDKFVSECVERDEDLPTDERMTTGEVHARYKAWCRNNDLPEDGGQRELTYQLKSEGVGYSSSVRINGTVQRGYKHLRLSDEVPDLDDDTDRDSSQSGLDDL